MRFSIYRYNPETDKEPSMKDYELEIPEGSDMMLLEALILLKDKDSSLTFRRSCREGVCGSDGMNINGKNGLACITPVSSLKQPIVVRPLPGLPVIRYFVGDWAIFYQQYQKFKPYLITSDNPPEKARLQTPEERAELDGLYECILCACCSTSCPSYWWNPDKFIGPSGLLQSWRFVADSRDTAKEERLKDLEDAYSVFRCRGIMNCVDACPKGLNPTQAIGKLRTELIKS
ncbi:MAG: succinate dehydrogenase iron-sulfur subunit [Gammaproteobacteria bacterium]